MKIGNYSAAIEAYEKVTEMDPNNREAMRALGAAYEKQGLKDKAVSQYDQYLERYPGDADIAFHQANTLRWSRYSYRREDAMKYFRMGLKTRNDPRERLKYADMLAENKSTSKEAIAQYRLVIAREPHNGRAHAGLARMYAWNNLNDKALYENNLALAYGYSASDARHLDEDLSVGREPEAVGKVGFLSQAGTNYGLTGFTTSVYGRRDFGPYVTAHAEAGFESYWNAAANTPAAFMTAGVQYRIDPTHRIDADLGYHGLSVNAGDNVVGKLQYTSEGDQVTLRPGFKRELRYDSLLALSGSAAINAAEGRQATQGPDFGAARSNLFYSDIEFPKAVIPTTITPYFGMVTADSLSPDAELGLDVRSELGIIHDTGFDLGLGVFSQLQHYATDESGFTLNVNAFPLPGGIFTPKLFLNENPFASFKIRPSDKTEIGLSGGPALQYVSDATTPGSFKLGGQVQAYDNNRLSERLAWNVGAGYVDVSTVYSQLVINTALTYTF